MMSIVVVRISAGDMTWGILPLEISRKGGMRGGGWVHLKGENGVVQPWAGHRMPLLGAGWAISLVFCMNGCRKQEGLHFRCPWLFCARVGWYCLR